MTPIRTPLCTGVDVGAPGSGVEPLPTWRERNEDGQTTIYSVWEPTDIERRALAEGANVVLMVYAQRTPPIALAVAHGEGVERVLADPVDLGPVSADDIREATAQAKSRRWLRGAPTADPVDAQRPLTVLDRLRRWWSEQLARSVERLDARRPRFRLHHGERPSFPGWRRRG